VQIGITGALAGLADTGSLVVPGGIGQSRLASLLPMVHIALLKVDDLFPTLAHFVDAYPDAARDTANLNIISGPSRTADIEQTLTLVVHGPKFVHIILV
jgi:L-lactate dehydrogenase complex protein LldG